MTDANLSSEALFERWCDELIRTDREPDFALIASIEAVATGQGWSIREMAAVLAAGYKTHGFDPNLHPRGKDGKFIEKMGFVSFTIGGERHRGKVTAIYANDKQGTRLTVEKPDGSTMEVDPKIVTTVAAPKGQLKPGNVSKAAARRSRGGADLTPADTMAQLEESRRKQDAILGGQRLNQVIKSLDYAAYGKDYDGERDAMFDQFVANGRKSGLSDDEIRESFTSLFGNHAQPDAVDRALKKKGVAASALTAASRKFNPDLHPRGKDGKFIVKFGFVNVSLNELTPDDSSKTKFSPTGKKKEQRARVLDIIPDPKDPGNPDIKIETLDANGKQTGFATVKSDTITAAETQKARLDGEPTAPEMDEPGSLMDEVGDSYSTLEMDAVNFDDDLFGEIQNFVENDDREGLAAKLDEVLSADDSEATGKFDKRLNTLREMQSQLNASENEDVGLYEQNDAPGNSVPNAVDLSASDEPLDWRADGIQYDDERGVYLDAQGNELNADDVEEYDLDPTGTVSGPPDDMPRVGPDAGSETPNAFEEQDAADAGVRSEADVSMSDEAPDKSTRFDYFNSEGVDDWGKESMSNLSDEDLDLAIEDAKAGKGQSPKVDLQNLEAEKQFRELAPEGADPAYRDAVRAAKEFGRDPLPYDEWQAREENRKKLAAGPQFDWAGEMYDRLSDSVKKAGEREGRISLGDDGWDALTPEEQREIVSRGASNGKDAKRNLREMRSEAGSTDPADASTDDDRASDLIGEMESMISTLDDAEELGLTDEEKQQTIDELNAMREEFDTLDTDLAAPGGWFEDTSSVGNGTLLDTLDADPAFQERLQQWQNSGSMSDATDVAYDIIAIGRENGADDAAIRDAMETNFDSATWDQLKGEINFDAPGMGGYTVDDAGSPALADRNAEVIAQSKPFAQLKKGDVVLVKDNGYNGMPIPAEVRTVDSPDFMGNPRVEVRFMPDEDLGENGSWNDDWVPVGPNDIYEPSATAETPSAAPARTPAASGISSEQMEVGVRGELQTRAQSEAYNIEDEHDGPEAEAFTDALLSIDSATVGGRADEIYDAISDAREKRDFFVDSLENEDDAQMITDDFAWLDEMANSIERDYGSGDVDYDPRNDESLASEFETPTSPTSGKVDPQTLKPGDRVFESYLPSGAPDPKSEIATVTGEPREEMINGVKETIVPTTLGDFSFVQGDDDDFAVKAMGPAVEESAPAISKDEMKSLLKKRLFQPAANDPQIREAIATADEDTLLTVIGDPAGGGFYDDILARDDLSGKVLDRLAESPFWKDGTREVNGAVRPGPTEAQREKMYNHPNAGEMTPFRRESVKPAAPVTDADSQPAEWDGGDEVQWNPVTNKFVDAGGNELDTDQVEEYGLDPGGRFGKPSGMKDYTFGGQTEQQFKDNAQAQADGNSIAIDENGNATPKPPADVAKMRDEAAAKINADEAESFVPRNWAKSWKSAGELDEYLASLTPEQQAAEIDNAAKDKRSAKALPARLKKFSDEDLQAAFDVSSDGDGQREMKIELARRGLIKDAGDTKPKGGGGGSAPAAAPASGPADKDWLPSWKPGDTAPISELPVGAEVMFQGKYRRIGSPILIDGGDKDNPDDYRFRWWDGQQWDWVDGDTKFEVGSSGLNAQGKQKKLHAMGRKYHEAKSKATNESLAAKPPPAAPAARPKLSDPAIQKKLEFADMSAAEEGYGNVRNIIDSRREKIAGYIKEARAAGDDSITVKPASGTEQVIDLDLAEALAVDMGIIF